ncbi:MAG: LysM peptidoglycan-binding domain-containing protein [Desulfohalobiaceae bacterium]|nr:LysM peptidoglycan-binding domain-containing protein [Desulfohalobiaceae bacterium]MCF8085383.1 LysM peptidoglycan-binding domain-containing protein [Desulfohalobiaceae bacterium]
MRHRRRPLSIACAALSGLCLVASLCFASPPKLYFEKNLQEQNKERYAYRIKKGDHVYDILRRFKISSELRPRILERTKEFNPQIEDADRLEVGQRITIPLPPEQVRGELALSSRENGTRNASERERPRTTEAEGTTGEKTSAAGKKPTANGGKTSAAGKDSGGGKDAAGGKDLWSPPSRETEAEPEPEPKPEGKDKQRRLALKMLREMGFSPSAEDKILYPSQRGGWVHIDLDRTPILETPWGQSLLLVPDQYATSLIRKKVERTDLRACRVKDSWALTDLFQSLQKTTKSKLIFWSPGESLILNFRQMVLEMRALYQFVIKTGGRSRYYLFFRAPLAQERAAELLAGFLGPKEIRFYTIPDAKGARELTQIRPSSADPQEQPRFSFANLWPRVEDTLRSKGETPDPPGNRNPGTLLNFLRERDLAEKGTVRLQFLQEETPSTSVVLTLRATKLRLDPPAVLLPDNMADPYLCGLLGLEGYDGYSL